MTSVDLITAETWSPLHSEVVDRIDRDHRGDDVAAADVDPHLGGDGALLDLDHLALEHVARAELQGGLSLPTTGSRL
jgi:hypothetical protein